MATERIPILPGEVATQLAKRKVHTKRLLGVIAQTDAAKATMRRVVRDSPVDLGAYKNGWEVRRLTTTSKKGHKRTSVQLVNDTPYAGVIELGARPFTPPFQPIFEWAQRKAGDLAMGGKVKIGPQAFKVLKSGNLSYRGKASLDPDDLDELRAFTYGVINKFKQQGIAPKHVMQNALPFAAKALKRATTFYLKKDLGKKL